jgi:hypothetical protein
MSTIGSPGATKDREEALRLALEFVKACPEVRDGTGEEAAGTLTKMADTFLEYIKGKPTV